MKATETKTGVAVEILKLLEKEPKITPALMETMLPHYTRGSIKAALHYLTSLGHVSTLARGLYVITDLGKCVLRQLLDQSSRRTEA